MYRKSGSLLTNLTVHAVIDLTVLLTAVPHH
jgi:hypothetical protein